jgi:FixJ family two-component response regulator
VWVVDDAEAVRLIVASVLKDIYTVRCFSGIRDVEEAMKTDLPAAIVCDHRMRGEDGLDFLTRLQRSHPGIQRILMTGYGDVPLLTRAINEGALQHFLAKPFDQESLREKVGIAVANHNRWLKKSARQEKLEDLFHREESVGRRYAQRFGRLWRLTHAALIAVLVVAGVALGLGILVLLLLYVLKSFFGIDLFQNMHLKDLF